MLPKFSKNSDGCRAERVDVLVAAFFDCFCRTANVRNDDRPIGRQARVVTIVAETLEVRETLELLVKRFGRNKLASLRIYNSGGRLPEQNFSSRFIFNGRLRVH